jgi:LmbE family N-acetylglucosaminyl deacetylase
LGETLKIVVVSPHRDDAAFSLGLAVDHWLGAGHKVMVLNCFTQSDYAPFSDVSSLHPNDRTSFVSAVRRREDIAWTKLAGTALQWNDLDLLDAPLRLVCAVDEVLTLAIRPGDRAVARIAGALAKMARAVPAGQCAFVVPLAVGDHIDHRVARQAALDAVTDSAVPLAFYEDLPYAAQEGAAETLRSFAEQLQRGLQPCFVETAPLKVEDAIRRKAKIAQCYDSQIDSDVVARIADFSATYGGRERLWANAAWRDHALCVHEESRA